MIQDYDLCKGCYNQIGHKHKMEKIGGLEIGETSGEGAREEGQSQQQQQQQDDAKRMAIQRCINSLVHACQCRDANCHLASCHKMRRIMTHAKSCKRKNNKACSICRQLIALCCYHAKHCDQCKCAVPYCCTIKQKLLLQKNLQAQIMKRRIASLQLDNSGYSQAKNAPNAPSNIHAKNIYNSPSTSGHPQRPSSNSSSSSLQCSASK